MKFNPFAWKEETGNGQVQVRKGRVQLRLAREGAVYVSTEGVEALVGVGTTFDFELAAPSEVSVVAPSGTRWFRAVPDDTALVGAEGPVFSNIDRMPLIAGQVAEVTSALRLFKLEQQAVLRDLRAQRAKLRADKEAAPAAKPAAEPVEEAAK